MSCGSAETPRTPKCRHTFRPISTLKTLIHLWGVLSDVLASLSASMHRLWVFKTSRLCVALSPSGPDPDRLTLLPFRAQPPISSRQLPDSLKEESFLLFFLCYNGIVHVLLNKGQTPFSIVIYHLQVFNCLHSVVPPL